MKLFNERIAGAALFGLMLLPNIAVAQAQSIAPVAHFAPLDITGHFVAPATRPAFNLARFELLIADPFKDVFVVAVTPAIVAPRLSVACLTALPCP